MIDSASVFKIKDSVDLFLSNKKYIMAYYMNTRQRKGFRINSQMIHLIEMIDGKKSFAELCNEMARYDVDSADIEIVIDTMIKNRIITRKR